MKYNTSDGNLAWSKSLQGDVNFLSRRCDVQMMYMDSSKNIHAVMGFRAGTHLDGMITVPSTYTSSYKYYLVKFSYNNGNMTPEPIGASYDRRNKHRGDDGKVNLLYDESLNRYYLAGRRMYGESSTDYEAFSYNNVPFTKDGYLLAFDGTTGAELWRKELDGAVPGIVDNEIHSLIKDSESSDIYISGRYFAGTAAGTFGNYTFPLPNYTGQVPFVMRLNATEPCSGLKLQTGLPHTALIVL
ncbi:hypothetical protein EJ377_16195 [Chryseobacterium arthrosphaerae]|uniref:PilC beta-propeller domain-containing protein n=1 Tax=Chryseobacterium arthrosphaerae TaxID=651561 RepID=A0A3S0NKR5_9FLAO|nr:hypothetical protein EJ377_16195 [Chryseobacterium arthrosphaerae]